MIESVRDSLIPNTEESEFILASLYELFTNTFHSHKQNHIDPEIVYNEEDTNSMEIQSSQSAVENVEQEMVIHDGEVLTDCEIAIDGEIALDGDIAIDGEIVTASGIGIAYDTGTSPELGIVGQSVVAGCEIATDITDTEVASDAEIVTGSGVVIEGEVVMDGENQHLTCDEIVINSGCDLITDRDIVVKTDNKERKDSVLGKLQLQAPDGYITTS